MKRIISASWEGQSGFDVYLQATAAHKGSNESGLFGCLVENPALKSDFSNLLFPEALDSDAKMESGVRVVVPARLLEQRMQNISEQAGAKAKRSRNSQKPPKMGHLQNYVDFVRFCSAVEAQSGKPATIHIQKMETKRRRKAPTPDTLAKSLAE